MARSAEISIFVLLVLALCGGSLAEQTGPLAAVEWPAIRALLFLLVGVRSALQGPRTLYGWLLGSVLVAGFGSVGLDWALASMLAGEIRLSRRSVEIAAVAVALSAVIALAIRPDLGPLPFANRNHFAVFTEVVLPFLLWRVLREESKLAILGAALLLAVSFAAGSRAGALILCLEILWLAARLSTRRNFALAGASLAILLSLFVLFAPKERLRDPWRGDHRAEIWEASISMVAARPWTGWGIDRFADAYPAYARFDNGEHVQAAHSDWLEWGVEAGIPGIILPALILVWYLRRYGQSPAVWGILFGALHACVDFPWQRPEFLALTALLAGSFSAYASKTSRSHTAATESANFTRRTA